MFAVSEHNERIKHLYGNYCFWSWLRYWYIDSANLVTLLLLDKGYFDYDYEKTEAPVVYREKTEEELGGILAGFGLTQFKKQEPKTAEEIQNHIIKQMEDK